jgi:hypothetical protein
MSAISCIVGHNIFEYDLPMLIQYSDRHGVKVPVYLQPNRDKFRGYPPVYRDTMELHAAGKFKDFHKLETIARALGFEGGKNGKSGKDFWKLSHDEQEQYLSNDLRMTSHVWKKLNYSREICDTALIFDIETRPRDEEKIRHIMPDFDADAVKVGNIKDPDKIEAKIEEARENHFYSFYDKAQLKSEYSEPCAIGIIDPDETISLHFADTPESIATMLKVFWEKCSNVWGNNQY